MKIKIDKTGVWINQATKEGYIFCKYGGVADLSYLESKFRRGRVQEDGDICPTLTGSMQTVRIEKWKKQE